jgi:TRAP-type transport system periplasmic protein
VINIDKAPDGPEKEEAMPSSLKSIVVAMAVMIGLSAVSADAQTLLRFGHPDAPTHPIQISGEHFAKLIEERTDGRYRVEIYGQNTLGNQRELIESLQTGAVDFAVTGGGALASFFPKTQVFDLPFLFRDASAAEKLLDGEIGEELFADMRERNIVGLAWGTAGFRHMQNAVRPVSKPEDLAGLKIRIQPSPVFAALFEAVGAIPVPVDFAEVYTALQQGTVDGVELPVAAIHANKLYEVTKYNTLSGHSYNLAPFMMNQRRFDSLSAEDQEIFMQAGREAVVLIRQLFADNEDRLIKELEDLGMETSTIDFDAFSAAMAPVYDQFKDRIGADFVDRVLAQSRAQ